MSEILWPSRVALVITSHRAREAWALVHESDPSTPIATGVSGNNETHAETVMNAFSALLEQLSTHRLLKGAPLDLLTNNKQIREVMLENRKVAPNVEPAAHVSAHDPLMEATTTHAVEIAKAAGPVALHVGTDGARERHASVGGWGWISGEGHYGFSDNAATSPVEAEIEAIAHMLNATSGEADRPLVVWVDSTHAISLVNSALKGDRSGASSRAVYDALAPIAEHSHRDITLNHVKGHQGDPLNEGAHRLATLARRAERMQFDANIVDNIVASIISETVANYNAK